MTAYYVRSLRPSKWDPILDAYFTDDEDDSDGERQRVPDPPPDRPGPPDPIPIPRYWRDVVA